MTVRTAFVLSLALLASLLAGCRAAPGATYSAGDRRDLSAAEAEQAHRQAAGLVVFGPTLDKPFRLLKAPFPGLPAEAVRAGLQDSIVVEMLFNESGEVEKVTPLTYKESVLLGSVLVVVRDWKIEPPVRDGKPVKLRVRQAFEFKMEP